MGNVNSVGSVQPPAVHAGVNAAVCRISVSVTTSAGDVLQIGRLPHGAVLLDSVFYPGSALNGVSVLRAGTSASAELFMVSDTYSVAVVRQLTTLAGQEISLSDDVMPRFIGVTCTTVTALTVGHHGTLVVQYKMPPA
jgi:hypothetical protein